MGVSAISLQGDQYSLCPMASSRCGGWHRYCDSRKRGRCAEVALGLMYLAGQISCAYLQDQCQCLHKTLYGFICPDVSASGVVLTHGVVMVWHALPSILPGAPGTGHVPKQWSSACCTLCWIRERCVGRGLLTQCNQVRFAIAFLHYHHSALWNPVVEYFLHQPPFRKSYRCGLRRVQLHLATC